tara:strand:- start:231 stop:464 length:234 start_codon:yes stop_codon:yes gene_type:complete
MAKRPLAKRVKDVLGPVQPVISKAAEAKALAEALSNAAEVKAAEAKAAEAKEAAAEAARAAQRAIGAGRRLGGKLVG